MRDRLNAVGGLLTAVLLGLVVVMGALLVAGDGDAPPRTITAPGLVPEANVPAPTSVGVDGPDRNVEPDVVLELDRPAREIVQRAAAAPENLDLSGDLRGVDPTAPLQQEGPLATPNFPGCTTRMLQANWSNRTSTVKAIAPHYTAGGNRPGLSDMNGLTGYANSPAAGVSWHFLIDEEGHCYYSVPLAKKAWTIGNLNSQTVNIEMVGRGSEPGLFSRTAGARKLGEVVRRLGRIYGIPMRLGAVSNCTVTRSGIITHWMGGRCAGGHHDIKPYDIAAVARGIAGGAVTSTDRVTCRKLNWWRANGRPKGLAEANAVRRRRALESRGVTCTASGPVR